MIRFRWADVADHLATEPAGTRFRCARHLAEHPRDAGCEITVGLPVGQRADFRLPGAPTEGQLHVQDFGTHYEARFEATQATTHQNAAAAGVGATGATGMIAASAALGSVVGLVLGRTREASLTGAIFAAALGAVRRRKPQP